MKDSILQCTLNLDVSVLIGSDMYNGRIAPWRREEIVFQIHAIWKHFGVLPVEQNWAKLLHLFGKSRCKS